MTFFKIQTLRLISISLILFSVDANAGNFDYFAQLQYQQQVFQYQQLLQYQQAQYINPFNTFGFGYNFNSYNPFQVYSNNFYNGFAGFNNSYVNYNSYEPFSGIKIKRSSSSSSKSVSFEELELARIKADHEAFKLQGEKLYRERIAEEARIAETARLKASERSFSTKCLDCTKEYTSPSYLALDSFASSLKDSEERSLKREISSLKSDIKKTTKEIKKEELKGGFTDLAGLTELSKISEKSKTEDKTKLQEGFSELSGLTTLNKIGEKSKTVDKSKLNKGFAKLADLSEVSDFTAKKDKLSKGLGRLSGLTDLSEVPEVAKKEISEHTIKVTQVKTGTFETHDILKTENLREDIAKGKKVSFTLDPEAEKIMKAAHSETEVETAVKIKPVKVISVSDVFKDGFTPVSVTTVQIDIDQVPVTVNGQIVWVSHKPLHGTRTLYIKSSIQYDHVK